MPKPVLFFWETLPEYVATMQYSRCLGRVLASLPRRVRRRWGEPLSAAAVVIGGGIVGLNADLPADDRLPATEREAFRHRALFAIRWSRRGLRVLQRARRVNRAQITAARELLERIETGVRATEVAPDWL